MESTPSTPSSVYKPLSYKLEQFIDETLGDISTPVPTPTASVRLEVKNDTIQNIIEQVFYSLLLKNLFIILAIFSPNFW